MSGMEYDFRGHWVIALLLFFVCGTACVRSDSNGKGNTTKMPKGESNVLVVYTALGDSTGAGVGAREGGGYVERLFKRIKEERPNARLTNLCVSGATTGGVLRGQLETAITTRPTLVTLGIGINDIGHGIGVEQFARDYEELVKRLKAETTATIILTNVPDISFAPVVSSGARDETRRRINRFNQEIQAIAERYGVVMVDVYAETHRVIPSHPEMFSADGFHPSDAGYEYWAETMWPAIKVAIEK